MNATHHAEKKMSTPVEINVVYDEPTDHKHKSHKHKGTNTSTNQTGEEIQVPQEVKFYWDKISSFHSNNSSNTPQLSSLQEAKNTYARHTHELQFHQEVNNPVFGSYYDSLLDETKDQKRDCSVLSLPADSSKSISCHVAPLTTFPWTFPVEYEEYQERIHDREALNQQTTHYLSYQLFVHTRMNLLANLSAMFPVEILQLIQTFASEFSMDTHKLNSHISFFDSDSDLADSHETNQIEDDSGDTFTVDLRGNLDYDFFQNYQPHLRFCENHPNRHFSMLVHADSATPNGWGPFTHSVSGHLIQYNCHTRRWSDFGHFDHNQKDFRRVWYEYEITWPQFFGYHRIILLTHYKSIYFNAPKQPQKQIELFMNGNTRAASLLFLNNYVPHIRGSVLLYHVHKKTNQLLPLDCTDFRILIRYLKKLVPFYARYGKKVFSEHRYHFTSISDMRQSLLRFTQFDHVPSSSKSIKAVFLPKAAKWDPHHVNTSLVLDKVYCMLNGMMYPSPDHQKFSLDKEWKEFEFKDFGDLSLMSYSLSTGSCFAGCKTISFTIGQYSLTMKGFYPILCHQPFSPEASSSSSTCTKQEHQDSNLDSKTPVHTESEFINEGKANQKSVQSLCTAECVYVSFLFMFVST
jgi:hypothetical protein